MIEMIRNLFVRSHSDLLLMSSWSVNASCLFLSMIAVHAVPFVTRLLHKRPWWRLGIGFLFSALALIGTYVV
jgi:hypothetical protein